MFGERPGPLALLGMVVAVLGVVVSVRSPHVRTHPSGRPSATSANEPSAKERQSGAARYDRHDRYDPWLEPPAHRRPRGGGRRRPGAARRIGPAAHRRRQGALRRRLHLLQPADRPRCDATAPAAARPPTRSRWTPPPSRRASRRSSSRRARTRPGQTFQGIEPTATVRNADDGAVLATFTPPQLGTETALVVVEVYRRGGAWKVRAVGQGYANGLAGIATDFGVSVEEPAAAPAAAPPPAAARAPPAAPAAPAGPPHAAPPRRPRRAPRRPRPAPPAPGRSTSTRAGSASRRTRPSPWSRAAARCSPRSRWASAGSPPSAARTSTSTPPSSPTARNRNHIDSCYFGKLSILNGAIKHSGDNLTGEGAGDDEVIVVDLGRLPARGRRAWSSRSTPSRARSSPRSPRPTAG